MVGGATCVWTSKSSNEAKFPASDLLTSVFAFLFLYLYSCDALFVDVLNCFGGSQQWQLYESFVLGPGLLLAGCMYLCGGIYI